MNWKRSDGNMNVVGGKRCLCIGSKQKDCLDVGYSIIFS